MDWETMIVVLGEPGTRKESEEFHRHVNDGWELQAVRSASNVTLHGNTTLSYWRRPSTKRD